VGVLGGSGVHGIRDLFLNISNPEEDSFRDLILEMSNPEIGLGSERNRFGSAKAQKVLL
jgi:hypothetical protein